MCFTIIFLNNVIYYFKKKTKTFPQEALDPFLQSPQDSEAHFLPLATQEQITIRNAVCPHKPGSAGSCRKQGYLLSRGSRFGLESLLRGKGCVKAVGG